MSKHIYNFVTIALIGAIAGIASSYVYLNMRTPSQEELIHEFYNVETAASVSPHHVRKHIAQFDDSFILIDLRSQEEYEEEHIVGAVNIPAYASPDKSAYGDVERISRAFKELQSQNPDTDLIVYCYSIPCMTGRKMGKLAADNGVYVKHLGVGWNEWRYHWELWNHPHEWDVTDVKDYVISGSEPGKFSGEASLAPCIEGKFGC